MGQYVSNGSVCNEDMADITDWSDGDTGTGVSSQATFDSKSCMKLLTGATPGAAIRSRDVGTFGARTVISFSMYCDAIGTASAGDYLQLIINNGSTGVWMSFASDGLFIFNGTTSPEVGTNIVSQDAWQEWTFDINWTAQTLNVYLSRLLVGSAIDCSYTEATANGTIKFAQFGNTTAARLSYIDWLIVGSNFKSGLFTFHG